MHRPGGKCSVLSTVLSCSQSSFVSFYNCCIIGVPVTKRRVADTEVSCILSFVQRRLTILDVYHDNLLSDRNSTIANQEQTRSVILTPIMNSFADKKSTETRTEPYASRITITNSLKIEAQVAIVGLHLIIRFHAGWRAYLWDIFRMDSTVLLRNSSLQHKSMRLLFELKRTGITSQFSCVVKNGRLVLHSPFKHSKYLSIPIDD